MANTLASNSAPSDSINKGINLSPNAFAGYVRSLRLEHNELLGDMAKKLGVSSAYLSRIENGIAKPSPTLIDTLVKKYNLTGTKRNVLEEAGYMLRNKNLFDLSRMCARDKKMMIALAQRLPELTDEQIDAILQIIEP